MTERASGWYDDPEDDTRLRYWDGILWSDRTMPKLRPGLEHVGEARPIAPEQPRTHRDGADRSYPPLGVPMPPGSQAWPPQHAARRHREYAGVWRRVGAAVLDWVIVSFVVSLLVQPFLGARVDEMNDFNRLQLEAMRDGTSQPSISENLLVTLGIILGVMAVALTLYDAILTMRGGRTLGKLATGCRVMSADDTRMPFGRVLIRSALKWLPSFGTVFGLVIGAILLLPALASPRFQGVHDRLARTVVREGQKG